MKTLLLLLGIGGVLFLATRSTSASKQTTYIPTAADILGAGSREELDTYYELINELKVSGVIDSDIYNELHTAYVTRYNELAGEVE